MRNKFVITITDINGSKQFLLHQLVKKFVLYFTLAVIGVIVFGGWLISMLYGELSSLEEKKEELIQKEYQLGEHNAKLQRQIDAKTKQFEAINDKVSGIEELIGLKTPEATSIDERLENLTVTSTQQQHLFRSIPNGWVIENTGLTGKFGWRTHPILKTREFHRGIDLRAPIGTPIVAPADGVVEFAGYHKESGFGYLVIVQHNYGFKTSYAHLEKTMVVKSGEFVRKGQLIGYTGNSGLSTGPHLHYEVRFISRPLDPQHFLDWNSASFDEIFEKENRVSWQSLLKMITDPSHPQRPPS
ncbi:peptidoglycan DD-metalloendopeptidase family protein [Sulfurospirillum sp. T05]|uniref:Peptidoglycan DD-metalloendopeptidase family protein n=1 Tax=Sulfurospirillum tamanense TaxID=2813362 RepID=A0ABS2WQD4_9BACT|nr:M23 family metallopeptidase [Sulfurospirillum tamanensis]MBN2963897.1 peptidoglycan DD-metalloendopeptidase family protein [Sulfurospirillum tamanensis]